jgi:hypothetical protein
MILQHRFPFQLSNRTCAAAISVCLHVSDPISAVTVPPPLPLPLCISHFASTTTLRAAEKGVGLSAFSNSLPHCKNQGIRQPSWSPDKARTECYVAKEKSSPLAAVGTTFTSLLADEAAAECGQAGFQASFVLLLSYDHWLGRSLVRFVRLWCASYKGRVSRMGS